jgi:hypothetical protein
MLLIVFLATSCSEDTPEPQAAGEFALVTASLNADGSTRAFYLQRASVSSSLSIDNSAATELAAATAAMIHSYNGAVYFSDYATERKIQRWIIDDSNNATMTGEISTSELTFQGNTAFKDASTAFVGGISTEVIIFNPTTMQKTGKIDISAFSEIGTSTEFPMPGGTIGAESITDMVIRGNQLFLAVFPMTEVATYTPGKEGCTLLIIDLNMVDPNSQDNSDAVVKRIYDTRGSWTGAWGSGGGSSFMNVDENGDLYVLCHNNWTGGRAMFNKPAAILRVPAGSSDFDPNYYFDLESAAEGDGSPVINFEYYGNGKFLAAVQDPTAIDPENPFSYFIDPIYRWWSFDLQNKTAERVSDEYTRGALASVSFFENEYGYVPYEDETKDFVMRVNLNTMESTKLFDTNGVPHLFGLE